MNKYSLQLLTLIYFGNFFVQFFYLNTADMWYEAIPSIAIVAACLHIGPYGCLVLNYFLLNKHVSFIVNNIR